MRETPRLRLHALAMLPLAALALSACSPKQKETLRSGPRFHVVDLGASQITVTDAGIKQRLLRGFAGPREQGLEVEPAFAVRLDKPPVEDAEIYVELEFAVPRELDLTSGGVTVTAKVNGIDACQEKFLVADGYKMTCRVPDRALARPQLEVEFHADRSYRQADTGRELSLLVKTLRAFELEGTYGFQSPQVGKGRQAYAGLARRWKGVSLDETREALSVYHKLPTWRSAWFAGVPIVKNPLDLWTMQEIIFETKPEFILETGTLEGGSALYLASILDAAGLTGSRVITVDIAAGHRAAEANPLWSRYVEFIHASSTDPRMVAQLAARVKGRRTLVTLDSDHSLLHVLRELRLYAPMVSRGSYLIVEDTHLDGVPSYDGEYPGPMAAVERFLEQGGAQEFERDLTREPFLMTFNPGGWLKRK